MKGATHMPNPLIPPRKIKAVRPTEILPAGPDSMAAQYKQMIAQVVEERIAELMADKQAEDFRPFFEVQEVAQEMRRRLSVAENRKWRYYFEEWGRFVCETKDVGHRGLGMCHRCFNRRQKRLNDIRRSHATEEAPEVSYRKVRDGVRLAREALLPSINALAKRRKDQ
jgi:hypothetical protein